MKGGAVKYVALAAIAVAVVGLDQWTKDWAQTWLASPYTDPAQVVRFTVAPTDGDATLKEVLTRTLPWSEEAEIDGIIAKATLLNGKRHKSGPDTKLAVGTEIQLRQRSVEVFASWWHYKYVRNSGAAFGLMNDMEPGIRRWFFMGISLVAVGLIGMIYRNIDPAQWLLMGSLSLILGGAIGNFIDRIRLNYVIDFIDWHVGDAYHWPTFNIADSAITVGVALLCLEMLFGDKEPAKGSK